MDSSARTTPLRKLDSVVVLERSDSTVSSSNAYLRQATRPHTADETDGDSAGDVERGEAATAAMPVALDLSVRFGRVGALMAVAVSVLMALTLTFNRGVVIGDFDPTTTDADAQKKLLDDYNSYTGNVASLFGWPIEKFVALAVQVMLLRVLAASLLRTEVSWKTNALTLVIGAGVAYLISNGLNALNVQLQPPTVEPLITAADLAFVPDLSGSAAATRTTNLTQTFSERSPRNPITNTVLRNLVLPRVPTTTPTCIFPDGAFEVPVVVTEYGFSQRDWQSRLLQEALEPKQLRIVVNPADQTVHQSVSANDLPMDASLAGDLGYPNAASYLGLLPPATQALDEPAQREWFLHASAVALTKKLNKTVNTTQSDVVMEFSHVDISPTLRFDAFTIEVEIDRTRVPGARSKDNVTWYNRVKPEDQCGPWSLWCMMRNPKDIPDDDSPAQVQAFNTCATADGTEMLSYERSSQLAYGVECPHVSNTSFMLVSIGKRFVADAITQNKTVNATGSFDDPNHAVVTNLRRIYTYTIGKLSWESSDLAAEFNAECIKDGGSCNGLRLPLALAAKDTSQHQELIVGVDALPLHSIPELSSSNTLVLPLVQVREIPSKRAFKLKPYVSLLSMDPLLPHNLDSIVWDIDHPLPDPKICVTRVDTSLQSIVNNHLYIEHGLQTAYTAATFFLFQNSVVKDVIALNATSNSLNFQQNKQVVALLASIPDQNAWLTLSGCAVLVVGLCSVVVWAWATSKSETSDRCGGLGRVTTPHVIARVMLDSTQFPPLFLHRHVLGVGGSEGLVAEDTKETKCNPSSVEGYTIDGLTLQPPGGAKDA